MKSSSFRYRKANSAVFATRREAWEPHE